MPSVLAGAGAAVHHRRLALEEENAALRSERDTLRAELSDLKAQTESDTAIDIEIVKVGAVSVPQRVQALPDEPLWLAAFLVYNRGSGDVFTAAVVDQSVRSTTPSPYPVGSFQARWQLNDVPYQRIARDGDARVDLAYVGPRSSFVLFLLPNGHGQGLHAVDEVVTGLIDIEVVGRDARQRCEFRLLTGPTQPVDLTVTPV